MSNLQSFLAMGAMLILAFISLRFNSSVLQTSTTDFENKVYLTSFSLAENLIEEIKEKSFDQTTVDFPTVNPASLTPPDSLGPDSILTTTPHTLEKYPNFNDVDDFNNYHDSVSAPYFETYYIDCKVQYVSSTDPDSVSTTQTFYKRATVTVYSPFARHSISLSAIFTLK